MERVKLFLMRLAKSILIAFVVCILGVYALDCSAMQTPEQAMKCCGAMPCSSHRHQNMQDCCKTMPEIHAPYVQPQASAQNFSLTAAHVFLAPLASSPARVSLAFTDGIISAQWHAPPISSITALSPLRI